MPLTPSERARTVERLRKYPAGATWDRWGFGPLDAPDVFPEEASTYVKRKYG